MHLCLIRIKPVCIQTERNIAAQNKASGETDALFVSAGHAQTLNKSKEYTEEFVGSTHGYSDFETYIKAYCDNRYERR